MKKTLLICALTLVSVCASAQQLGFKSYDRSIGSTKEVGTYVCRNGSVTHTFSINGGRQQTKTYFCNPNVPGEDVIAVFDGIYCGRKAFFELAKVTPEEDFWDCQEYVSNAVSECGEAVGYYQKGGCDHRAEEFSHMIVALQEALKESDVDGLVRKVQNIRKEYSSLNTSSPCGYVY